MDYSKGEFHYSDEKLYNEFLRSMEEVHIYQTNKPNNSSPPSTPTSFLDNPIFSSSSTTNSNSSIDIFPSSNSGYNVDSIPNSSLPNSSFDLQIVDSNDMYKYISDPLLPSDSNIIKGIPSLPPLSSLDNHLLNNNFQKNNLPYNHNNNNINFLEIGNGVTVRILVQPEAYQIVNYNIFKQPELEFSNSINEPLTIQAILIYKDDSNGNIIQIKEGFTNGDIQVLKVGQTHITFPALHLNRMTPIKSAVQQGGGSSLGHNFAILFKIGNISLISEKFKLLSACSQIPGGMDVRPRKPKDKQQKEIQTPEIYSPSLPPNKLVSKSIPSTSKSKSKRQAVAEPSYEEDRFLHVKVRGEEKPRGFIVLSKDANLQQAREEISYSNAYPQNFRFWFEKMSTIVQPHQESSIKAIDAVDGSTLILEKYDLTLQNIDDEILNLWLLKNDKKEPLVPLAELTRTLFTIYRVNTTDINQLNIINSGISHFFVNVSKLRDQSSNIQTAVSLEDFKLFLKFFGPTTDCLNRVLNVYKEPFFHGFARHSDAVEELKGKPGYYLIRYSESQLKDGFFAFNVNKGNNERDIIENYSIRYDSEEGCFIFRDIKYQTLGDFVRDPQYSQILRHPLPKTKAETVKTSKYRSATDLIRVE